MWALVTQAVSTVFLSYHPPIHTHISSKFTTQNVKMRAKSIHMQYTQVLRKLCLFNVVSTHGIQIFFLGHVFSVAVAWLREVNVMQNSKKPPLILFKGHLAKGAEF